VGIDKKVRELNVKVVRNSGCNVRSRMACQCMIEAFQG
jgi:hypothetical protein